MRKMDDLHLLDFVELRLKSKGDFNKAYDVAMHTGLAAYLKKFIVFSQRIGHANCIVDKSYMNHLRSLSALIQDFQTLLCNRTIFYLIIPRILFQWHLVLLQISWTTACHKQHHSVISTNYWATSHFLKQQRTLCSFLSSVFQNSIWNNFLKKQIGR